MAAIVSYCINPNCSYPENHNNLLYCTACGSKLLIEGQYQAVKKISDDLGIATYEVEVKGEETLEILKVLNINSQEFISQFQQQAKVLAEINHPGVPRVKPGGYFTFLPRNSNQELHCLVIEKIPGENLQTWLGKNNLPLDQELALEWLTQLIEILDLLHKKQFFYQNIQPSNIILRPNGQLTLTNFSLELQSAESDFVALGYTFIYLLTGQLPSTFLNSDTNTLNWRNQVPNVSPKLADFIDDLISDKQPKNTQILLQRLANLKDNLSQPLIPKKSYPIQRKLFLGTGILLLGLAATQIFSYFQQKLNPERIFPENQQRQIQDDKLEKFFSQNSGKFLVGGIILILAIGGSHFVGYFRIHPKHLKLSLPNGVSLEATLNTDSERVYSVVISQDGQVLACGNGDGTIQVWHLEIGEELEIEELGIIEGHTNDVVAIAISKDGNILASGSYDGTIKIWHLETETELTLQSHFMRVTSIAITPDGEKLVSGSSDDSIKIWHLPTGKMLHTFRGHSDSIYGINISPDGKILVTGSHNNIKTWNLETGIEISTLVGHQGRILSVSFSPDGNKIASGSSDKTIKIWQLETGKILQTLSGHSNEVNSVIISPDNQTLVSGSKDHTIKIWHLETGKLLRTIKGHSRWVNSVAFSPNGEILASGSFDKSIKLWKLG
ncbi:MAG: protein kinase [Okeania sp. SIO3I5]|uniref:WD40 repeat domain-containing serine/threonine-protein kinase n=1 Tax=Okeania sp. SIO3I5 TaxID=2607805 RepID=UPI0013BD168A|nr:WD40 repeat domain-containing serine/threonine-protein kinase [Okeania sp. SIO3I5]NEQ41006.1 protein kinase [Okeania sp. SIO3I5]